MTYYPINEDTAKRANDANSFRDYKPGSATAAYRAEVDKAAALAEKQKAKVDPMHHDKLDGLLDRYAHRLQIIFDDKPDDDLRQELKQYGFRWAPSVGAWQRQLTKNALYAAKRIEALAPVEK